MKKLNFVIPVIAVLLACSLACNITWNIDKTKLQESSESLKNSLTEVSMQLDSVQAANDSLQVVLDKYSYLTDSLDVIIETNEKQLKWFKSQLTKLETEVEELSSDSIYTTLKTLYSTNDTVDKYAFSEGETVGIYKDVTKIPIMSNIISTQDSLIDNQSMKLDLRQNIINVLNEDNNAKRDLIQSLYQNASNTAIQLDLSEADNRRLKKSLRMWQTGTLSAGGVILLILMII